MNYRVKDIKQVVLHAQGGSGATGYIDGVWNGQPQKKEWVGLTDEEIAEIAATPAAIPGSYVHSFACAIEAKLKEKNN